MLAFVLSLITWIPGLCLYAVNASLAGWGWVADNLWLAGAILGGSLIWIAVLSLIALALSAWIKWRIAAGALVLAVFFAGAGAAAAINSVLRTTNGSYVDLSQVVHTIWADLVPLRFRLRYAGRPRLGGAARGGRPLRGPPGAAHPRL